MVCRRHRSTFCQRPSCQHRLPWQWPSSATQRPKNLILKRKRTCTSKICMLPLHYTFVSLTFTCLAFAKVSVQYSLLFSVEYLNVFTAKKHRSTGLLSYKPRNKCLGNAKKPCDCSLLCLRPKSSLCSCPDCILDITSVTTHVIRQH